MSEFKIKKMFAFLILAVISSTMILESINVIPSVNDGNFIQQSYAVTSADYHTPAIITGTSTSTTITTIASTTGTITQSIGEICGDGIDDNTNGQIDEGCNLPPDCSTVVPNPAIILSTDHHMQEINLEGAIDPNNDPMVVVINDIIQDEPTIGLGIDDQTPDALLIDGDTVQLRSEMTLEGDGRVYYISFVIYDGKGGQCDGVVAVNVPNDQIGMAVDSGTYFSSRQ